MGAHDTVGAMAHPYFAVPTPVVIGHRGAAGERPENTLVSFAHALAQGAAILESDIHPTRDGHVVMIHDDELERTTDGEGLVSHHTLAELQSLDAGHRFTSDGGRSHPFRGQGLRIPTLDEAFRMFPGARFNLELKERTPGFVDGVLGLVRAAGRADRTLLAAGSDELMLELRRACAEHGVPVAIGASAGDVLRFVGAALKGEEPAPGPMALQVPADFAGRPLVTDAFVRHAHAHGVAVHVWTINEPEEMRRLLALGVDGLVTDFPGRMREVISERRAAAGA
jgi:glycerophosphoryl diester phosphodiesterase